MKVDHFREMDVDGGMILVYNCVIKFTLEQATKAQRGSRGIAILFL
jgi:hypothetical protein